MKTLFKTWLRPVKAVIYDKKIAHQKMPEMIREKYEAAKSVFRGFFGEPLEDYDTFTLYKKVYNESDVKDRKFRQSKNLLTSLGFEMYVSRSDDNYIKIHVIPFSMIRDYLNSRFNGRDYQHIVQLYKLLDND